MAIINKWSLFIIAGLLAFTACKKDQINEQITIIEPTPEIIVNGSVTGIVVNQNGEAVEATEIKIGLHAVLTDENGVFTFKNISLNEKGALITATKEGYFPGAKFVRANLNKMAFTKITLLDRTLSGSFSSSSGATVTTNGDARADILDWNLIYYCFV